MVASWRPGPPPYATGSISVRRLAHTRRWLLAGTPADPTPASAADLPGLAALRRDDTWPIANLTDAPGRLPAPAVYDTHDPATHTSPM